MKPNLGERLLAKLAILVCMIWGFGVVLKVIVPR